MKHSFEQVSEAFGLSHKEGLVFETLLSRGMQAASRIAKSVALPRNTTRNILDRLVSLGLVERRRKANSNLYRVEAFKALERSLVERNRELSRRFNEQLRAIQDIKPLLAEGSVNRQKPNIRFYDDVDGVVRVYEDTLSANETIRAWASFDANKKALPDYFPSYYRRRAAAKIGIKSIHPDTALSRSHKKNNKRERRTCVLVPQELLPICPEIQVYDNKINLVSWEDQVGILIESEALAAALKRIFDLCFTLANK